ncbi:MAG: fumarylacetoacetate hydrolase family protein [Chloroflexota bacterium]
MRLLQYRDLQGEHLGALREGMVVPLQAASLQGEPLPDNLLELIEAGPDALHRARELMQSSNAERLAVPITSVEVVAPIQPRENVMAIGRNYAEHAAEQANKRGEQTGKPTFFTKARSAITGPYSDISLHPEITRQVDWEAELGVVIGKQGTNIQAENAQEFVFGYTVLNDVSARDIQYGWGSQFFKGKSLDGFCPIGPYVVTADEVPDPQNLQLTLRVNGEVKQKASTAGMVHPIGEVVSLLSQGMTLFPGNVIATGTPAGVGYARTPQEFLRAGDVMETEVVGLGIMRNKMVE